MGCKLKKTNFFTGAFGRKSLVLLLACLVSMASGFNRVAAEQCECGFQDGQFTTGTGILIDGFITDWRSVLDDPDNNICDGGYTKQGATIEPWPDRDAPVQSTGRDVLHFAHTWDFKGVQTYTRRAASDANVQRFIYYADVDSDQLMETGEPVIVAQWKGSNRDVRIYLGTYVEKISGGDSMVDADGFGDGYTLPGSAIGFPSVGNPNYQGDWGSDDGLAMEWEVLWSDLGVPPGTPFAFHIGSTNSQPGASSFPGQVDDNMGGCGGGAASMQFADLSFAPDRSLEAGQGEVVYAAHTVSNLGNGEDTFNLTSIVSGDFTPFVSYYKDADGSGTLTAGDTLLTDTDGDGNPDTGPLAAASFDGTVNGTIDILIEYDVGTDTGTATAVVTAISAFQPLVEKSVTDAITVVLAPDLVIMKTVQSFSDPVNQAINPKSIPGAVMLYTIQVSNFGAGPVDVDTVEITDPIPDHTALLLDVNGPGSGPVEFQDGNPTSGLTYTFQDLSNISDDISFSNDNGSSYDYFPTPDAQGCDGNVTHLKIAPKGMFNGTNGGTPSFQLRFKVRID